MHDIDASRERVQIQRTESRNGREVRFNTRATGSGGTELPPPQIAEMRRTRRGDKEISGGAYPLDELDVELGVGEEHVGAGVAVEHELALPVGAEGDEGERGARPGVEHDPAVVDAVVAEDGREHPPELVVPQLADERGPAAEPRHRDGHVRRRPLAP